MQIDFWDKETGYYLNGTYYGAKNLLGIGAAIQAQDGDTATTVDFLMEKRVGEGGVVTVESEYANYDNLGGYDGRYGESEGAYILAAFLFPKPVGIGKFEVLGKYANATFREGGVLADYDQDTTEFNFNYVIKEFNARLMFFVIDTSYSAVKSGGVRIGAGLQIQM